MKRRDFRKQIRELPAVELESEIQKAREKLWKIKFQARGEPVENPGEIRALKAQIAQMLTVLGELDRSGRTAGGSAPTEAAGETAEAAGTGG